MGCNLIHLAERISGARFLPPTELSVNMKIKASARTKYMNLHFYIAKTIFLSYPHSLKGIPLICVCLQSWQLNGEYLRRFVSDVFN